MLRRTKVVLLASGLTVLGLRVAMVYEPSRAWIQDKLALGALRLLDPERGHELAVWAAKSGLVAKESEYEDEVCLEQTLWGGLRFGNPVGIAAGFDKNAEAISPLLQAGFGFVEVGTVTPEAQTGNARPRVFRLSEDRAVINRYGFNGEGMIEVEKRLAAFRSTELPPRAISGGVVGVNVGKNKWTEDAASDCVKCIERLGPWADYLVVNVSSPNTPGLRDFQEGNRLRGVLRASLQARDEVVERVRGRTAKSPRVPFVHGVEMTVHTFMHGPRWVLRPQIKLPLLVKIAPDMTEEQLQAVVDAALDTGVDGIIVSNTTVSRPPYLRSAHRKEAGGLSGTPLRDMSTRMVHNTYALTQGRIPIIGVGGVSTARDALDKIEAGACLVQMYTALVYNGMRSAVDLKHDLAKLLRSQGYRNVEEAIGAAHRKQDRAQTLTAPRETS